MLLGAFDSSAVRLFARRGLTGVLLAAASGCAVPDDRTDGPEGAIGRRSGFHAGQRAAATEFTWPHGIRAGQSLTEDQAVAVALWNNPEFQAALAELGVARADVIKAGELTNPAIGLLFPANSSALELTASLPLEALWLRPQRLKAARLDAQAVADNLTQGGLDVIRSVRVACAGIDLARKRRQFAEQSAGSFAAMADVAEARLKSGDTGELEPAQARAEAGVSQQESRRLAYEEKLAVETLRGLLGLSSSGASLTLRPLAPVRSGSPRSVSSLVKEALASRPDVRAAELTLLAAGVRARMARAEILNLIAAGKYTRGSGTQPGFDTTLPLLQQNQSGRAAADARVEKALRQLNVVRERAAAEVRTARVKLEQARAVSNGWDKILPSLRGAVEKARRAVDLGETDQLVALDAARRLSEAQSKAAESEARLREAWADLERAAGKKLP